MLRASFLHVGNAVPHVVSVSLALEYLEHGAEPILVDQPLVQNDGSLNLQPHRRTTHWKTVSKPIHACNEVELRDNNFHIKLV